MENNKIQDISLEKRKQMVNKRNNHYKISEEILKHGLVMTENTFDTERGKYIVRTALFRNNIFQYKIKNGQVVEVNDLTKMAWKLRHEKARNKNQKESAAKDMPVKVGFYSGNIYPYDEKGIEECCKVVYSSNEKELEALKKEARSKCDRCYENITAQKGLYFSEFRKFYNVYNET